MKIAQVIAGFNLQEADVLRKAIGKKKADIMTRVEGQFIKGCQKEGNKSYSGKKGKGTGGEL